MNSLTIAPGERADVLVDFSSLSAGDTVLVKNVANTPYPDGDSVFDETGKPLDVAQIMQFTVTGKTGKTNLKLPTVLNDDLTGSWPTLPEPDNTRILTLNEVASEGPDGGPLEALLNGQKWIAPVSEEPQEGSTEEWVIVNLTGVLTQSICTWYSSNLSADNL